MVWLKNKTKQTTERKCSQEDRIEIMLFLFIYFWIDDYISECSMSIEDFHIKLLLFFNIFSLATALFKSTHTRAPFWYLFLKQQNLKICLKLLLVTLKGF